MNQARMRQIHLTSITRNKHAVEIVIKHVVNVEHAVVVDQIKEETQKDSQPQKLSARIHTGDWVNNTRKTQT